MDNVGIIGLGHCLPEKRLTNADLEKMVETSDDWITTRTGIKERRIAEKGQRTSDLAIGAAKEALADSSLKVSDIELIVVATISPDSNFPSVACLVQKAIGATKAAAFDISAACSGFLYGVTTAKQFLKTGLYENALVIAAEKITSFIDWNDRDTCVLFGDGAGACVLGEVDPGKGIISDYMHAQGQFGELMTVMADDRHPLDQTTETMKIPKVLFQITTTFQKLSGEKTHNCIHLQIRQRTHAGNWNKYQLGYAHSADTTPQNQGDRRK